MVSKRRPGLAAFVWPLLGVLGACAIAIPVPLQRAEPKVYPSTSSTASPITRTVPPPPTRPQPLGSPDVWSGGGEASGSPTPEPEDVWKSVPAGPIVAKARATFGALPGFHFRHHYFQRDGDDRAEGDEDVTGRPLRTYRIIEMTYPAGAKVLWTGGPTAKVRQTGLLSLILLEMALEDERLLSLRNYTIDQQDIVATFDILDDPRNTVEAIQQTGHTAATLIATGPALLPGLEMLTVELDERSLIGAVKGSDAGGLPYQSTLSNFESLDSVDLEI